MEDLYIVKLLPDEFHELLSEYEHYREGFEEQTETVTRALTFQKRETNIEWLIEKQIEIAERVLKRLREADVLHACLDEQSQPTHTKQVKEFTRDDVARIAASLLTSVFEKSRLQHIVQGIAVFPAGEGVYLIDGVVQDLTTESTWGVSITIPPTEEETDGLG